MRSQRKHKKIAMHQETALHETFNCWHLDLGLPRSQNCEKYIPVVYKPPRTTVCHIIKATQKNKDSGLCNTMNRIYLTAIMMRRKQTEKLDTKIYIFFMTPYRSSRTGESNLDRSD